MHPVPAAEIETDQWSLRATGEIGHDLVDIGSATPEMMSIGATPLRVLRLLVPRAAPGRLCIFDDCVNDGTILDQQRNPTDLGYDRAARIAGDAVERLPTTGAPKNPGRDDSR